MTHSAPPTAKSAPPDFIALSRLTVTSKLETLIAESDNQQSFGYIVIRLTCVHQVNIAYGYQRTDELLKRCLSRIQQVTRPQDQLVRIGEYEFALLLPRLKNIGHAILAANRIHSELSSPFTLEGELINITAATGVASMPEHASSAEDLMIKADIALETSLAMNTPYEVYTNLNENKNRPTIKLTHDLKTAIAQNELEMYFQPKIDLNTGRICSVEALTRWYREDQGYIDPEYFISIAEQSSLINALTRWSLTAGCRQWKLWEDKFGVSLSIAINISTTVLLDPQTVDSVLHALELWDANPSMITLEVTESMMMQQPKQSLQCLSRLRDLGIRLSIDDFGTGSSSLAYLKQLPVNELKIDKSFVLNMADDLGDLTIVRSVIDLANNFNLDVIAEGVENQATLDQLQKMGCGYAQGFYMGKPMSAKEIDAWLLESPWGIDATPPQPS